MHQTNEHHMPVAALAGSRLRRGMLLLAVLLFTTLSIPSPQSASAQQQPLPGSFTLAECPFPPVEIVQVDCGYLTVAESRQNFTGKTIQIAVAILRSPNPNPASDPVFFLTGGPGQAALPLVIGVALLYAPILQQRDMVLFDQRGTGYSQPLLNCANVPLTIGPLRLRLSQQQDRPAILQAQYERLVSCGQNWQAQGVDLRAYTSVENAADIEDLRIALGYDQINLFGVSYGSRLALTAMRYRPETLRSVILESTYPLPANLHTDAFNSFSQMLTHLFAACASTPACNAAYPNLEQTLLELVPRLNENAVQVPIINPLTGELVDYLPFTGVDFTILLFQLAYNTAVIPQLPRLIYETAQGDYALLSRFLSLLLFQSQQTVEALRFGDMMQIAVQCNEDVTFAEPNDFIAARDRYPLSSPLAFQLIANESILDVCATLGLYKPAPPENQAVISDVATLIVAGEFDPITPYAYAQEVDANLRNNFLVAYPHGGHSPSGGSPCLTSIITAFLANPLQQPDTSCTTQEAPLPFDVAQEGGQ